MTAQEPVNFFPKNCGISTFWENLPVAPRAPSEARHFLYLHYSGYLRSETYELVRANGWQNGFFFFFFSEIFIFS